MKKHIKLRGLLAVLICMTMFIGVSSVVMAKEISMDFGYFENGPTSEDKENITKNFNDVFKDRVFDSDTELEIKGAFYVQAELYIYDSKQNIVFYYIKPCSSGPRYGIGTTEGGELTPVPGSSSVSGVNLLNYYNRITRKNVEKVKVTRCDISYEDNGKTTATVVLGEMTEELSNNDNAIEKEDKKENKKEAPVHEHYYSWNVVSEATESGDGLELYQCSCGDVQARSVIPASQAYVSKFRDIIKNAPANGTVTYDSKMNHTFSDYIIKRLAERTDVTIAIDFKWQNADYTMTIPAGVDYAPFFADTENFYGYFCFAQMTGASIVAK